ncbi:MAG: hypothetical protein JWN25_839 [Verrucomicrobiales bacterium]|nr:hypothetical protein [Verrucomicrobiales bacterium]
MSARKDPFVSNPIEGASSVHLSILPSHDVSFHENGLTFQSNEPVDLWKELVVELACPSGQTRIEGSVVVVDCKPTEANRYFVTVVFTHISDQSQSALSALAFS